MINLLIVDDNKDFVINLFNLIKKNNNKINVVGICVNGLDAYKKIKILKPDVVLLDIQMPILNGFQIAKKLFDEKINMPKIILITAHYELLSSFNNSNLIYGILLKPINYRTLNKILDSLIEEKHLDGLNNKIIGILSNFDFNVKSKGYKYLIESIKACLTFPHLIDNLEKNLYPYISNQFINTNSSKIKWAVEKSINSMYRYTDVQILERFFPNSKKLSPKYFIEIITSKINNIK